jgi:hypothetical protein
MSLPNSPFRVANNAAERNVNVIAAAIGKRPPRHVQRGAGVQQTGLIPLNGSKALLVPLPEPEVSNEKQRFAQIASMDLRYAGQIGEQ